MFRADLDCKWCVFTTPPPPNFRDLQEIYGGGGGSGPTKALSH